MLIDQMHTYFRQYAQQMGMQNVRAILPEQIDLLINTSISDIVNKIIQENIGITSDRIVSDNSKIGQINALRTLYAVDEIEFTKKARDIKTLNLRLPKINDDQGEETIIAATIGTSSPSGIAQDISGGYLENYDDVAYSSSTYETSIVAIVTSVVKNIDPSAVVSATVNRKPTQSLAGSVSITIESDITITIAAFDSDGDAANLDTDTEHAAAETFESNKYIFNINEDCIYPGLIKATTLLSDFLFLVDFSVNYKKVSTGIAIGNTGSVVYTNGDNAFTSNYFPVRLIDDAYLSDTLNDFILKPRLRSPILTVYNDNVYDFYIDSFVKSGSYYSFKEGLLPYKFRCSYVKKPAQVKYGIDLNVANVNCDLPEYLHVDIVKHAVDLYRVAVQGAPMIGQRSQNQENTPNNQS